MKSFLILALLIAVVVFGWAGCDSVQEGSLGSSPTSTPSPEPLVPTPVGRTSSMETDQDVSATSLPLVSLPAVPPQGRERFGVGVPLGSAGSIADYAVERLGIGWYLNWWVEVSPPRPERVAFWQMIRVSEKGYQPDPATIRAAAEANPGSMWLVGNEPDVTWQDNTTPERYAERYHELYHLLKSADPTCWVAIGGVAQPTPLRLAYLDRILSAYQAHYGEPMPVDVWNVHN